MGRELDLGKIMVTPNGEWNATTQYEFLSIVYHDGSGYIAVRDNINVQPDTEGNDAWMLFAQKGQAPKLTLDADGNLYANGVFLSNVLAVLRATNETVTIAENTRLVNEARRVNAEEERIEAENSRIAAENARRTAETNRSSAETTRNRAENNRVSQESTRELAESTRILNENARISAENERKIAENARISYENQRIRQEAAREEASANAIREAREHSQEAIDAAELTSQQAVARANQASSISESSSADARAAALEARQNIGAVVAAGGECFAIVNNDGLLQLVYDDSADYTLGGEIDANGDVQLSITF